MIRFFVVPAVLAMSLAASVNVSEAKPGGCIKGAAAGAVAGHLLHHHAVLGAMAGCAVGMHRRHVYKEQMRQQAAPDNSPHT